MQVSTVNSNSSLAQHRQRLSDSANQDKARAELLEQQGQSDLDRADTNTQTAAALRDQGQTLKDESNRLRRNGRDQSLRGLDRLKRADEAYSDSFQKQDSGLDNLDRAVDTLSGTHSDKAGALDQIAGGLQEQTDSNTTQTGALDQLIDKSGQTEALTAEKKELAEGLQGNIEARQGLLNDQGQQVDEFLLAGNDFGNAAQTKQAGFETLTEAAGHRVKADGLKDAQSEQKLQQTWSSADAGRRKDGERQLYFSSLFESLKGRANQIRADFHRSAAERGDLRADELSKVATEMGVQASAQLGQARCLEQAGQQHIAIGQQMKCCPWTYYQGVLLEQQGRSEIAYAQEIKTQATEMREQAQQKRAQAQADRVRAEQAREIGGERSDSAVRHKTRSGILRERSLSHGVKATEQTEQAHRAEALAAEYGKQADSETERFQRLQKEGRTTIDGGLLDQREALTRQGESSTKFSGSVKAESGFQDNANQSASELSSNLGKGRSLLGESDKLVDELRGSLSAESGSQKTVKEGIAKFGSALDGSIEAAKDAREAAQMLDEARSLELEGLRLQNRGQKMLLSARPKMADAKRLSSQAYAAFDQAHGSEEEAARLIESGNQKLNAAAILKEKAEAYQKLAEKL